MLRFKVTYAVWLALVACLLSVAKATVEYDFIVVGGGTAGVAVGTRLSQRLPACTVLIVEAGPDGRENPQIYIPGRKGSTLGTALDWNFTTIPQAGANNRIIPQNRGRVLGGSSALNLLSYDRATKADYDAWEQLGNPGWNWQSMHAAMENAETFQLTSTPGEAEITGTGHTGPIRFLINAFSPAQQEQFFPTMQNLGLNETFSFLNGDMVGYMRHTSNILNTNYTRSYSPSYLASAELNLYLMLNATVARIDMDAKSCVTGVTLRDGTVLKARKEVILSAGSIQSPSLLELSGIGNASILSAAGIKPRVDLPTVGENLQDHIRITTAYKLKPNYTSPDILRLNATYAAQQLHRYSANQSSFYDETSSGYAYLTWQQALGNDSALVALARATAVPSNSVDMRKLANLIDTTKRVPQLEIIFSDGYLGLKGYPAANSSEYGSQYFALIASVNHAFSRGSTHINSSNVDHYPVFNPNYLSNNYDLQAVKEGAKYLRKIAETAPLSYAVVDEYEPGVKVVNTDAEWVEYAKNNALSIWHPLGTCAMLPQHEGGVVDAELRVYGVQGLRVVDASIIPILISGHIQTAVYGIAERAAQMIAECWE